MRTIAQHHAQALKQWFLRYGEEVMNAHDFDLAARKYWDANFSNPYAEGFEPGVRGMMEQIEPFVEAFPDVRFDVEDLLVEEHKIAVRMMVKGTHKTPFMGIPPSGREVHFPMVAFFEVGENGRLTAVYPVVDWLTAFGQIGQFPTQS